MVTFPKVYAMNMESPTLLVVDSTVVVVYPKVYVISTEGLAQHVACSVQYGEHWRPESKVRKRDKKGWQEG